LKTAIGKTAPRLLEDLYDYDSRRPRRAGENVLIDSPEIFTGGIARSRILKGDCHHAFFRKDAQSKTPNVDKIPAEGSRYISASYCGRCLHHFDIIADYGCRPERKIPCRPGSKYPLHHLRHVTSETKSDLDVPQGEDKYDAWIEKHIWVCSASDCPVVIEIRITPPRLDREKADILANTERLALRGRRTIESEPARYEGYTSLLPAEVLSLLRAYLTDALLGESKRVAARNKKFKLSFADECDEIFEYLDFAPQYEQKPDGDVSQIPLLFILASNASFDLHILSESR
jgi:ubiquitin carboxyl-terminal hydrolase 25/28